MSEENTAHHADAEHDHKHCLCCEAHEALNRMFQCWGGSEQVKQHFRQSRIEFLKGVRSLLDQRIERLGRTEQKGTRIVVE
jgi:hypothetical protein